MRMESGLCVPPSCLQSWMCHKDKLRGEGKKEKKIVFIWKYLNLDFYLLSLFMGILLHNIMLPNEFLPTLFSNCSLTFCFGFFAYIMRDLRCKYSSSNSSCQVSTLPSSFKPFKRSFGVTNCLECREVTPLCGKTIFEVCLKSSHHFSSS